MCVKNKFIIEIAVFFLLVTCLVLPAAAAENPGVHELWRKAVAIAELNQNLIPGTMYAHIQEFNLKGKVKKEEESWAKYQADSTGEITMVLIKQLENGCDVTKKRKDELAKNEPANEKKTPKSKRNREIGYDLEGTNPFNPGVQNKVAVIPADRQERVNGHMCAVFEYTWNISDQEQQKGKAWLDHETGTPIRIEYSLNPLPKNVEYYTNRVDYQQEKNRWYPRMIVMKFNPHVLFYKAEILMEIQMDDFWEPKIK